MIYTRQKTGKLIKAPLQPQAVDLIEKYSIKDNTYLFPILSNFHKTELQRANRVHKVISKVNERLKEIGKALDIPIDLTTYVARHAWASIARSKNIPVSTISEAMGHDSETTTRIYLASLDTSVVDKANSLILKSL